MLAPRSAPAVLDLILEVLYASEVGDTPPNVEHHIEGCLWHDQRGVFSNFANENIMSGRGRSTFAPEVGGGRQVPQEFNQVSNRFSTRALPTLGGGQEKLLNSSKTQNHGPAL
jgi:hypothetical protein